MGRAPWTPHCPVPPLGGGGGGGGFSRAIIAQHMLRGRDGRARCAVQCCALTAMQNAGPQPETIHPLHVARLRCWQAGPSSPPPSHPALTWKQTGTKSGPVHCIRQRAHLQLPRRRCRVKLSSAQDSPNKLPSSGGASSCLQKQHIPGSRYCSVPRPVARHHTCRRLSAHSRWQHETLAATWACFQALLMVYPTLHCLRPDNER